MSDTTHRPLEVLKESFGFNAFRPGQEEIIQTILGGQNLLAVMPTGAGKSICYQVPALVMDGLTVVVSPLVALMNDQVAGLRANGIAAACIHSGQTYAENVAQWKTVTTGAAKLLYLSPERLMTNKMIQALQKLPLSMVVVDEAHCISKWGTSFRPDYEDLQHLRTHFPNIRLSAFTATADVATRNDISRKLFGAGGKMFVHGFDRPNLQLAASPKSEWKKQLLTFLKDNGNQSGIVYCLSRKSTEEVAAFLNTNDYAALPYHAGLSTEMRTRHQERFMAEDGLIMVATIAFGMGIDKADIRFVFHLNLPSSMEAYYQEIGRAGRDGNPAKTHMLYSMSDIRMRRQFIDDDGGDTEHKIREHKRLDSLLAYCETASCRRKALLAYFGEEQAACGNCDNCLNPPQLLEGTNFAQMLFSAIVRTGQSFGAAHVIQVLRGNMTDKIEQRGHHHLPTFGVGKEQSQKFWHNLIRQAAAAGHLLINIQQYGALQLTESGAAILKGEGEFFYREAPKSRKEERARKSAPVTQLSQANTDLLKTLKQFRLQLAQERDVPAFVIFPDRTLIEMAEHQPQNLEEFAALNGVGPRKLEEFGEVFLKVINQAA